MTTEEWNRLQIELYQMLKSNSDDVSLTDVLSYYKDDINIWDGFVKVLLKNLNDFDTHASIRSIQEHFGYLIIKFDIWDYLIIDMNSNKVLTLDEVSQVFGEKFFMDNFNEDQIGLSNYYFYESVNPRDIVSYYLSYKSVLTRDRVIRYEVCDDRGRIGIDYNLVKNDITLYMHGFGEQLRVNYLFFDGDVNPRGVSNPSGNMEELKLIANDLKNISVSKSMLMNRGKELKLD